VHTCIFTCKHTYTCERNNQTRALPRLSQKSHPIFYFSHVIKVLSLVRTFVVAPSYSSDEPSYFAHAIETQHTSKDSHTPIGSHACKYLGNFLVQPSIFLLLVDEHSSFNDAPVRARNHRHLCIQCVVSTSPSCTCLDTADEQAASTIRFYAPEITGK
jgi:hypothetical protein